MAAVLDEQLRTGEQELKASTTSSDLHKYTSKLSLLVNVSAYSVILMTAMCISSLRDLAQRSDHVTPAIEVPSRHRLRSTNRHRLIVPRCRLNTYGLFRLLVRRSGTHCSQMNSEIRRVMSTASNSSLKQSCSALTSVTSALEVIFNVMRSLNPRFTYFNYF